MDDTKQFKNFMVAHSTRNRVRILVPSLRKDEERAYVLEILLRKRPGITSVKSVPQIASVTVRFDPIRLPESNLLNLLDSVISNIGLKPRQKLNSIKNKNTDKGKEPQDYLIGIGGMSCLSCALFIEMLLKREPEVEKATVNFLSETARIKGFLSKETLFAIISANGYQPFSIDSLAERKLVLDMERKHLISAKKRLVAVAALSLPVALLSIFRSRLNSLTLLQALLATPIVIGGGRDIFKRALNQAKQGAANSDSLIALGVGSAYLYSLPALWRSDRHAYFDAAAGIIDFVLIGRFLEELAKQKVVAEIRKLVNLQPKEATIFKDDKETRIGVEHIRIGDILLIRPGEKIPADGIVIKGLSSVDESQVSGSSIPAIKETGHKVYEGCINGSGVLYIRSTAIGKDTVLSGLMHMVDQAQSTKLNVQKTVDRVSSALIPSVMTLSGLTFIGWLSKGVGVGHALSNAIAVLLISCPCALGLATPAATMVGTGQAARRGIYIRNGQALETAAGIDTVIFDKTGTITEGNANVTDFLNVSQWDDDRVIQLAAAAEFNSEHFLGQALVRFAKLRGLDCLDSSQFHSYPDQGIRAQVGDHQLLLGNESWLEAHKIDLTALKATAKRLSKQGKTLIFMAIDHQAVALFGVYDQVKPNAGSVIKLLQDKRFDTMMVTGDSEEVAALVAHEIGISQFIAQATPKKKLQMIRDLQKRQHLVAMVGDGINDAPALAAANLGMAIDNGTHIAMHAADLILADNDIGKVAEAIAISEKTLKKIRQNLFWAFGYNAVAIPLAMAGKLNPTVASASMAFSSVSVIINSLTLKR